MIELKILIDELDYDSTADYLIPALAESMACLLYTSPSPRDCS